MTKIISKTIEIICKNLPPSVDFIEEEIKKQGIDPIRWAIINVQNDKLTLSISGQKLQ